MRWHREKWTKPNIRTLNSNEFPQNNYLYKREQHEYYLFMSMLNNKLCLYLTKWHRLYGSYHASEFRANACSHLYLSIAYFSIVSFQLHLGLPLPHLRRVDEFLISTHSSNFLINWGATSTFFLIHIWEYQKPWKKITKKSQQKPGNTHERFLFVVITFEIIIIATFSEKGEHHHKTKMDYNTDNYKIGNGLSLLIPT